MKKLLLIILLLSSFLCLKSQEYKDTIIITNNDKIICSIIEINKDNIIFKVEEYGEDKTINKSIIRKFYSSTLGWFDLEIKTPKQNLANSNDTIKFLIQEINNSNNKIKLLEKDIINIKNGNSSVKKAWYCGLLFEIFGSALILTSNSANPENIYIGAIIGSAGAAIQMSSISNLYSKNKTCYSEPENE